MAVLAHGSRKLLTALALTLFVSVAVIVPLGVARGAGGNPALVGHTLVSAPPTGNKGPDDITLLNTPALDGGNPMVWTAYQNGIQANGTAGHPGGLTTSTVAGYDAFTGALIAKINVTGKSDGLTADSFTGKLISTLNEDSRSRIAMIDPATGTVTYYTYSPDPAIPAVTGNGGTDSIAVINGKLYLAHSNPNDVTQPAEYLATLNDTTHTANLTPIFFCNSAAASINRGTAVTLGLTDPDTNFVMPQDSPNYPGALVQIGQADGEVIFSQPTQSGTKLWQLNITDNKAGNVPPTDGFAVATSDQGWLYVVDASGNNIQVFDTSGWPTGTVFIGEPKDAGNPMVGTLNLKTGVITPFANHFVSPKGLLFVPKLPTLPLAKTFVSAPPSGSKGPDDITLLSVPAVDNGNWVVWTAYQNGIQPNGTAGTHGGKNQSTVVGYDATTGAVVATFMVTGKSDGLTANQATGKLISTLNEDSHSKIASIDPTAGTVTYYTYSPDPSVSGNGGTDSISIINGSIFLAHSNPNDLTQPAVYQVTLNDATHTAALTALYNCNSAATSIITGETVNLAVTDPDSNFAMPQTSAFPEELAQLFQADGQIVFSSPSGTNLQVLNVTDNRAGTVPVIDGFAVATSDQGTLYVIDAKGNKIQAFDTSGWPTGTVFIGEPSDTGNPLVGTLNLQTGVITPFANSFVSPKGLLFVPWAIQPTAVTATVTNEVTQTSTAVSSFTSTLVSTQISIQVSTQISTSASVSTTTETTSNAGFDDLLYGVIAVLAIVVIAVGYLAARRGK